MSKSGRRPTRLPRSIAALLLSATLAQGCAALGGTGEAPDTFDLVAPRDVTAGPVRRGTQILIAEPGAVQALDSQNIVVETAPFAIQYLGDAQWGDRLPRLVQRRLAESFDRADRFDGVGLPGQGLAIDYQIVTNIAEFGIDIPAAAAQIEIQVKLLNDRNGVVASDRRFAASVPVSRTGSPDDYVAALNTAFGVVAREIVAWSADLI
ncbi:MAG: membrane integrity-associated transporter subunit PqiC [Roseitalea sp.]|nr:membrane integrity-associated transporter subunit PqiC [Roseitalea sp.]MBO6721772.1 membrane integrity-associated transporter subunit PqiC [Roseitalea sp.]MBO6741620.1 membrane integrity-associated transporter subunit PqiC [Roseitalea sp.]